MACCGSQHSSQRPSPATPPREAALFEYHGAGPLTLFGKVTGRRYHFPGPGARARVDGRDADVMRVMRGVEPCS